MELAEGANSFRILAPAIVGYEWWEDTGNGDRVPRRVRTAEEVPSEVRNATHSRDKAKHFWAFPVFNYTTNTIQVLELKQQTILRADEGIADLAKHVPVRLEALYAGQDPFAVPDAEEDETQNGNTRRERSAHRRVHAAS